MVISRLTFRGRGSPDTGTTEGGLMSGVTRRRRLATATGLGLVAMGVLSLTVACTSSAGPAPARPAATVKPAPAHPSATQAPPKGPLLDPFTGEPVKALGPVLAVKIDNIVYARPQTGLQSADIVLRDPGRGRAHPVHGRLLLAHPAGRRAGAQRQAERPRHPAPVRAARLRLVGRHPAPGAVHRAGADRRPVRACSGRLLPCPQPGRALQPVRERQGSCSPRRRAQARPAISGSGSARCPPAGRAPRPIR